MENSGKTLKYLSIDEILRVAEEHVGRYQLLHEDRLHYLVQIVGEQIGGAELFPTLAQKAAVYSHHIITRHIFLDGKKRTDMHCALLFFELNGFSHPAGIDDSIVELGLNIANGTILILRRSPTICSHGWSSKRTKMVQIKCGAPC